MKAKYGVALGALLVFGVAARVSAQQASVTAPRQQAAEPQLQPQQPQQPQPAQAGAARMSPALTMLMQGIPLTDAQKLQLDSVVRTSRAEIARTRDSILAAAKPPDSAGRARMLDLVNREYTGIRGVLTVEQQAAFDSRLAELQAAIRSRMATRR